MNVRQSKIEQYQLGGNQEALILIEGAELSLLLLKSGGLKDEVVKRMEID